MKYLLLSLLLYSCATPPRVIKIKPPQVKKETKIDFISRMQQCMMTFSEQGFDSKAIISICESVYKRRK